MKEVFTTFWKIIPVNWEGNIMRQKKIAVIGGGAAGIVAAITAAGQGAEVTIFERNDRIGKKILATGNGKCNLGNLYMTPECFNTMDPKKLSRCLERFSTKETIAFFEELGLMIKEKNGYLYPISEQAAVVLDILRIAVARKKIRVLLETKVTGIQPFKGVFEVSWNQGKEYFDKVILCCGSKAAPKTGSDGNGYEIARKLGHSIVPIVPSLVQLKCSDPFCKGLSGVRAECIIHIYEDTHLLCKEAGEVQLTDYGISGIPVFQLSALVNRRLADKKHGQLKAKIDFLPEMADSLFSALQTKRLKQRSSLTVEEFFTGMLNKKLMMLFIKLAGLNPAAYAKDVSPKQLQKVFAYCKGLEYHITGHNGFENAQVCSGGVDLGEVTVSLESVKVPGLFFAGELLDVDGRCGGYNLQWAWTSGYIAGRGVCND